MTVSSFSLTDTKVGKAFALIPASDKPIGTSACSTCFSAGTCDHGKKVTADQSKERIDMNMKKDEDNKAAVAASLHMAEGLSIPFRLVDYPSGGKPGSNRVLQYRLLVNDKYFWVDVPVIPFQDATTEA